MRLLPVLLLLAPPALAQAPPACTPSHEGMVACFGEKLCECRWEPGGTITGRAGGFRWDCGVLRPACGTVPAGPPPGDSPPISIMPLLQPQQGSGTQGGTPQSIDPRPGAFPR
ncbi:hypothetical protein [Roseicella aquatilis]|uniref:Uncharacterized protein n=1 Tax=Roseicella aquatilis TaxID=2527868 RepID=A0A4R4DXN6_9PROT|nr:hypothetical protein [Roseicella aquatilis]TCZ66569.1 hypothetical protein EXY23_00170 [Roseicella aquatilis]